MDGNIVVGYNLTAKGLEVFPQGIGLKGEESPVLQHLASGMTREEIKKYVNEGILEPRIFAKKPMDVRLPKELVDVINERIDAGDLFSINILTSRDYKDVQYVLKESGVHHPERLTVVADSGNSIRVAGEAPKELRPLTDEEKTFKNGVAGIVPQVEKRIREFLGTRAPEGDLLRVENKPYGFNLHYRELLAVLGISDEKDETAKAIGKIVSEAMAEYAKASPKETLFDGREQAVFKVGGGPMTCELKLATVTKAMGFHALLDVMKAHGREPSDVIFAGDDSFKHTTQPDGRVIIGHGTDYYAMMYAKGNPCEGVGGVQIQKPENVAGHVIHTHHPVGEALDGTTPDPAKAVPKDHVLHPSTGNGVDLLLPTPQMTATFVVEAVRRMEKALEKAKAAPGTKVEEMRPLPHQPQQAQAFGVGR